MLWLSVWWNFIIETSGTRRRHTPLLNSNLTIFFPEMETVFFFLFRAFSILQQNSFFARYFLIGYSIAYLHKIHPTPQTTITITGWGFRVNQVIVFRIYILKYCVILKQRNVQHTENFYDILLTIHLLINMLYTPPSHTTTTRV